MAVSSLPMRAESLHLCCGIGYFQPRGLSDDRGGKPENTTKPYESDEPAQGANKKVVHWNHTPLRSISGTGDVSCNDDGSG